MPKKYRLSRADFTRLPKPTRRIHGTYFSLTVTPAPLLGGPRTACVVSKKVSARSVDRNRIERRCRESIRPMLGQMRKAEALVLFAKREATTATFKEIQQDIQKLLERVA